MCPVWSVMFLCLKEFAKIDFHVSEFKIRTNEYNPLCDKNAPHALYELVTDKVEKFVWIKLGRSC